MNKQITYTHTLTLILILTCSHLHAWSIKNISSWFGGKPFQSVVNKDYTLSPHGAIHIKNIHGSINVAVGLDKQSVALKATKHARDQKDLTHMHIVEEKVTPQLLSLCSTYDHDHIQAAIAYDLTIPEQATLHITTEIGDITIERVKGPITISTGQGTINVCYSEQPVHATITQQGSIAIAHAAHDVTAHTNRGEIILRHTNRCVSTTNHRGNTSIIIKQLPAQANIQAQTDKGTITFMLPGHAHATLAAEALHGTVTSSRSITLDHMVTTLDSCYWQKVKQSVRGTIFPHVPEQAESKALLHAQPGHIQLTSRQGNVRIR